MQKKKSLMLAVFTLVTVCSTLLASAPAEAAPPAEPFACNNTLCDDPPHADQCSYERYCRCFFTLGVCDALDCDQHPQ